MLEEGEAEPQEADHSQEVLDKADKQEVSAVCKFNKLTEYKFFYSNGFS